MRTLRLLIPGGVFLVRPLMSESATMDSALALGTCLHIPDIPSLRRQLPSDPGFAEACVSLQTRANLRSFAHSGVYSRVLEGCVWCAPGRRGEAIARSVLEKRGLSIAVMFPRQSGKNMLQAQLEVYLLTRFARIGAEMAGSTYQPQSLNAMRRLETALQANC